MSGILGEKLGRYKRKYYLNILIRNSAIFTCGVLGIWIFFTLLEFNFSFGVSTRTIFFYLLTTSLLGLLIFGIVIPCLFLTGIRKPISDENAARNIGKYFPSVADKLLNTIQLSTESSSSLASASIDRRLEELSRFQFQEAVNFKVNKKYYQTLFFILVIIVAGALLYPTIFIQSSSRILNHRTEYLPEAPFEFILLNEKLQTFRDEDFTLRTSVVGDKTPDEVFASFSGRKVKMQKEDDGKFSFTFQQPYESVNFRLEAAGFYSENHTLEVVNRPTINSFDIQLRYPAYTELEGEVVQNNGNLSIPEGTLVSWNVRSFYTEQGAIYFQSGDTLQLAKNEDLLSGQKILLNDDQYEIRSRNRHGANKETLSYQIQVTKDDHPELEVSYYLDTVLYEYIIIAGQANDDYGIRSIQLHSNVKGENSRTLVSTQGSKRSKSFYTQIRLDSLNITQGDRSEIYVVATDNDEVNGFKTSRSKSWVFQIPDESEIEKDLEEKVSESQSNIEKSVDKAQKLNEKLKEVQKRLKSSKQIDWQDEKLLQEILKQRQELEKSIQQLNSEFEQLNESQDKFDERNEELQEKADQIKELMEEILDDETKKLYDELQKLLEEQAKSEDIQDLLDQMSPNEDNLEQELERTLELFKRLQMESKLDRTINKLEQLQEEQSNLAEETGSNEKSTEQILEEQKAIEEKFDQIQEEFDEVQELNQNLKNPEPMQDFSEDEQEISNSINESQEQLQNQQRKEGQKSQQQSSQQMKSLAQKMQEMQESMQGEMVQENLDNLRDIVDNLVKLSFTEEQLIKDFREVRQVDPRFVDLSQQQLKLKDDAEVIQDSLISLASRVPQISNFVTREVSEMNTNIDKALKELRNRNRSKALSNQQFSMTSINNLALLLSDVLEQMQQAMASQSGKGQGKDKKGNSMPQLKELQKQLGQQIEELQKSGLQGRKLSEQLAKMAARQEMIRNQLREFQKQLEGQPGNKEAGDQLGKVLEKMEENEVDLVNKRLTKELVERQKEIETRMLEAESSLKEQGFDKKREAETALEYDQRKPKAFDEYLKEKEKELELIKSVPLDLSPFYKKELNDYFRRISSEN